MTLALLAMEMEPKPPHRPGIRLEPCGELLRGEVAGRKRDYLMNGVSFIGVEAHAIQLEEHGGESEGNALVPVMERMVFGNGVGVACGKGE